MAPTAAETVYRAPGKPWLLWDLDPYDPAGSETVAVEYQASIDKLFSRLKKRLLAIDLQKLDYYKNHVTLVHTADVLTVTAHVDTIVTDMQGEAQNAIAGVTLKSYQQGQLYGHYLLKPYAPGETGAPFTIGKHDQHLVDILTQQGLTSIKGVTDDVRKEIGRVLGEGLLAGEGINDLTKRLHSAIEEFNWNRAELIARTETVAALNRGSLEYFKKREIKSYYWLSCRDDHTCFECQALDGEEFPVDAPTNRLPPLHPRCRCTMVPVIRGLNDDQVLKKLPDSFWEKPVALKDGVVFWTPGGQDLMKLFKQYLPEEKLWKNVDSYHMAKYGLKSGSEAGKRTGVIWRTDDLIDGLVVTSKSGSEINIDVIASTGQLKGTGRKLVEGVIAKSPGKIITTTAESAAAKAFFKKVGFEIVEDGGDEFGALMRYVPKTAKVPVAPVPKKAPTLKKVKVPKKKPPAQPVKAPTPPEPLPTPPEPQPAAPVKPKRVRKKKYDPIEVTKEGTFSNRISERELNKLTDEYVTRCSKLQYEDIVKEYCGSAYRDWNKYLRSPTTVGLSKTPAEYAKMTKDLNKVIDKAGKPVKGIQLFRGIGEKSGESVSKLEVGDICQDAAFQSFSTKPSTAKWFAKLWWPVGAPSSHKTVLRVITSGKQAALHVDRLDEAEFIFKAGTQFKVLSKEIITDPKSATPIDLITLTEI